MGILGAFLATVILGLAIGVSVLFRSPLAFFAPLLIIAEKFWSRRAPAKGYWKSALVLVVVP